MPVASAGLRLIVRRPYAETATSVYDYPLSSRFDETDALVIFDRVLVPWRLLLVYRDVALTQAQFYETPAHVLGNHQAQVRFASQSASSWRGWRSASPSPSAWTRPGADPDHARRARQLLRDGFRAGPHLGGPSACTMSAASSTPNPTYLYANNWLEATYFQTMLTYLRELAGGGLLQLPSSYKDYLNPEICARPRALRPLARGSSRWSGRSSTSSRGIWSARSSPGGISSTSSSTRGARAQTTAVRAYRAFDFAAARAMVERCLGGLRGLPTERI